MQHRNRFFPYFSRVVGIILMLFSTASLNAAQQKKITVALQPLGSFNPKTVEILQKEITEFYQAEVIILKTLPLPQKAYYKPRSRYRAEKLLDYLESVKPPQAHHILGLTEVDISTTKPPYEDWGLFGLGDMPGPACVISSFRLAKRVSGKTLTEYLIKNALHELGHNLGLDHCPNSCLMQDAKGTIKTVEKEPKALCPLCRKKLGME